MLTTSPSMTSRSLRHPDLIGLPPAIRHRGHDGNHVFRYQSPMPAGAGTPRYENWLHWLVEGLRCRLCPPPLPWLGTSPSATFLSCDPGLSLFGRRWLVSPAGAGIDPGSESGTCFRTNRPCRLAAAHQCMKIEVLTGGGVCGSFATHTPTLDSGFRRNDAWGAGMTSAGAVAFRHS